jgi:hypothetical protein
MGLMCGLAQSSGLQWLVFILVRRLIQEHARTWVFWKALMPSRIWIGIRGSHTSRGVKSGWFIAGVPASGKTSSKWYTPSS